MKAVELRQQDQSQLKEKLSGLLREQLKLRLDKAAGELAKHHRVKEIRRDIARILTLIHEKKRA